ncbi:phosphoribosyltransferase [Nonomuraea soli]|uniref:Putative phosphoribosyl transferase n=1 Tax=Nonomuraea soli TaxID=1032476 RepID=A0A7W0HTC0_9ACTN|nr:phosphoribosyltransferase family protein [Nonomuraea soli]MBA2894566.1 putative phosphoribosyl transferase [Nonomuraea soli]
MGHLFADRSEAGALLAERLHGMRDPIVLALPRGGVPVAVPIVRRLGGTLDVLVTRKIGYPPTPELGVGAVCEGGEPVFDTKLMDRLGLTERDLSEVVARELRELDRRVSAYRGERRLPPLTGREVVVVDDGLATGVTARAALRAVAAAKPGRLTLAVPVAAQETVRSLRAETDEVVVLATPAGFRAVGQWYGSFGQLSDGDVLSLLEQR